MRWKKLSFVHDWKRKRKPGAISTFGPTNLKQSDLADALAAAIIIHDLSPAREVEIENYEPSLKILDAVLPEIRVSPPADPAPSETKIPLAEMEEYDLQSLCESLEAGKVDIKDKEMVVEPEEQSILNTEESVEHLAEEKSEESTEETIKKDDKEEDEKEEEEEEVETTMKVEGKEQREEKRVEVGEREEVEDERQEDKLGLKADKEAEEEEEGKKETEELSVESVRVERVEEEKEKYKRDEEVGEDKLEFVEAEKGDEMKEESIKEKQEMEKSKADSSVVVTAVLEKKEENEEVEKNSVAYVSAEKLREVKKENSGKKIEMRKTEMESSLVMEVKLEKVEENEEVVESKLESVTAKKVELKEEKVKEKEALKGKMEPSAVLEVKLEKKEESGEAEESKSEYVAARIVEEVRKEKNEGKEAQKVEIESSAVVNVNLEKNGEEEEVEKTKMESPVLAGAELLKKDAAEDKVKFAIALEVKKEKIKEDEGIAESGMESLTVKTLKEKKEDAERGEAISTVEFSKITASESTDIQLEEKPCRNFLFATVKTTCSDDEQDKTFCIPDLRDLSDIETLLNKIRNKSCLIDKTPFPTRLINDKQIKQKREIAKLNDCFASLIEQTRFFEAVNKKASSDLQMFNRYKGPEKLYAKEIAEAKELSKKLDEECSELDKQITALRNEYNEKQKHFDNVLQLELYERKEIDRLITDYSQIEFESNLLKRRISETEDEVARLHEKNTFYTSLLNTTRKDAAEQRLFKLTQNNAAHVLLEEISLLHLEQDHELEELQASLIQKSNDSCKDSFKNDLTNALTEIRKEHEQKVSAARQELEFWYKMKSQEVQLNIDRKETDKQLIAEEMKKLQKQIVSLRKRSADYEEQNLQLLQLFAALSGQIKEEQRKHAAVLSESDAMIKNLCEEYTVLNRELQNLVKMKQSLEDEIGLYRNLMQKTDSFVGSGTTVKALRPKLITTEVEDTRLNEDMATTSWTTLEQRGKTDVIIEEVSTDGCYITIKNTNSIKPEPIGDWQLQRCLETGPDVIYKFPSYFVLQPNEIVKICSKGTNNNESADSSNCFWFIKDITFERNNSGQIELLNSEGKRFATHSQKTTVTTTLLRKNNSIDGDDTVVPTENDHLLEH
ncbi:unnamed protein product [Enterobius vermicularis]|uniref:LTD domain-containing protein n=1 Tax=Enterobius vermicularis TaxID=51028 RepID=A0A0N4VHS5_ENTVE|nr:unnamed protein product [Enterobius vermicularis]